MPRFHEVLKPVKEQAPELCRNIVNLFKVIAYEENDIEGLRQVFAHMPDFTMN